jgi:hypothetical protein
MRKTSREKYLLRPDWITESLMRTNETDLTVRTEILVAHPVVRINITEVML